jgi:hydroxymethylpyrimidine/phosphomethylpyrimidine kinase
MEKIMDKKPVVVMTIAGSDSGGGAGISADLATFSRLGLHGTFAITAVTVQNSLGLFGVCALDPGFVSRQIEITSEDMPPSAVKCGMLYDPDIVSAVAESLKKIGAKNIVLDPVAFSSSGGRLLKQGALARLRQKLFPMADLITPNIDEAETISGLKITGVDSMVLAGRKISSMYGTSVVVTGGHGDGKIVTDVLVTATGDIKLFERKKVKTTHTHGTGCVFSSAVAGYLASGHDLLSAVDFGGSFVFKALKKSVGIGKGSGPVNLRHDD